jgi:PAS domain S-box-containing protein
MGDLKNQLEETRRELCKSLKEKKLLQKAIWDMLNHANMYVVLLDDKMNIKLINYSLATKLGYKNEDEAIGKCWLNFIKEGERIKLEAIHKDITNNKDSKYIEYENEIVTKDGEEILIKWFNIPINSEYHMTFSFGVSRVDPVEITEDSIRSYYRDIIEKDKTMIRTLKETVLSKGYVTDSVCKPGTR